MRDDETIDAYDRGAEAYAEMPLSDESDPALTAFMAQLPDGAFVLDLGCGPGRASEAMRASGYRVDPVDASAAMVNLANEKFDVGARQATFDDINARDIYDGVWANFSLLHASKTMFPAYLQRLHNALKPNGVLHLGMKTGNGERRDRLGRQYAYYGEKELKRVLSETDFEAIQTTTGEAEGLAGDVEPWITILSRRS